jgi:hypothetical protein
MMAGATPVRTLRSVRATRPEAPCPASAAAAFHWLPAGKRPAMIMMAGRSLRACDAARAAGSRRFQLMARRQSRELEPQATARARPRPSRRLRSGGRARKIPSPRHPPSQVAAAPRPPGAAASGAPPGPAAHWPAGTGPVTMPESQWPGCQCRPGRSSGLPGIRAAVQGPTRPGRPNRARALLARSWRAPAGRRPGVVQWPCDGQFKFRARCNAALSIGWAATKRL